ncbi:acetate--CoA ligase [Mucisphaera calidilacus]|uniref:Acetyl-coenzyme A synthetase n=1 Tax=Mucisphaera calidilacus TaxID=2527982 RepID=A0A518BZ67_9BACT|nr:acetate--CoA ligase [Mucisphaera calidilacus]QDU72268.1 Acetyl-coenzyme A ligase [Mucisphaera calidilacus]
MADTQPKGDAESMESVLHEERKFPPPPAFAAQAHVKSLDEYETLHKESVDNPEKFWAEQAADLHWFQKWDRVLEWDLPDAKWFVGAKTNLAYNCLDRQVEAGLGDRTAIIWEGEPTPGGQPEVRRISYKQLLDDVSRFANVLKDLGVKKGDVVTIYMPMVPELAVAMLACARIGAPHSIIFGGFSASAIRDRVEDGQSKIIITADGGWRRGKPVPLKENVDEALTMTDRVEKVVVLERCQNPVTMKEGRDHWWHECAADASADCPAEHMDAEDLLFILYTSGSTGKPKGIMHTTAGYMVYTATTAGITFDLKPATAQAESPDVYWCTADIGWITGHSYIIYGLLPNRVPTLMYEGAPDTPDKDRFWDIIERHKVTKFYTAPTAIRAFMKWGSEHIDKHDISSLQLLGTVGEPINPEAWMWYHQTIGNEKCPIVDTWWQTETGGHMLTPVPGATTTVPGSCTRPFFGIDAAVVNSEGDEMPTNAGGILVIRKPWPSMLRGIYGNRQRFIDTYWSKVEGYYTAGDGARKDQDGNFWIMGRIDDVIVVAGHNLGTMEVESALVSHPAVAEAAVVGFPHEIKGTGIASFVTLRGGVEGTDQLVEEIRDHVAHELGPISKPDLVRFTDALPKTRSGKIMRRLLRDIAAGREITQDMTTLEDVSILAKLQGQG